jgi:hypothetical protein
VLACCTPDLVNDNRTWWKRSGFASRVLPIRYGHSLSLQFKIMQAIANDGAVKPVSHLKIPETEINVQVLKKEAQDLLTLSAQLATYYGEMGYRRQHQMRALACGLALLRTWRNPRVTQKEIMFISESLSFFTQGKEL